MNESDACMNAAVRFMAGARKLHHIKPLLRERHWFLVCASIKEYRRQALIFACERVCLLLSHLQTP